ncbi:hypothetical protein AJ87_45600 [Rhizobium yanglingense]|nr:hypothetical protein AJ87_45600 [Rhizobium yanglingense]
MHAELNSRPAAKTPQHPTHAAQWLAGTDTSLRLLKIPLAFKGTISLPPVHPFEAKRSIELKFGKVPGDHLRQSRRARDAVCRNARTFADRAKLELSVDVVSYITLPA